VQDTQTAALGFGGTADPPVSAATEEYNGTSWTTLSASLSTARDSLGGAGTQYFSISFWWVLIQLLQQQQKNTQVQEHH
jgi:hypothetical protein